MKTHLPTHTGTIRSGRIAERGERITCPACRRQIAQAASAWPSYVAELQRNLQPGYVEQIYTNPSARNASLAENAVHFWNIATYEVVK